MLFGNSNNGQDNQSGNIPMPQFEKSSNSSDPWDTYEGVAKYNLQFFWLLDCSSSMYGEKISTLNNAIRTAIPLIQKATEDNPRAHLIMRAIKFANRAEWHIGPQPVDIENFVWKDLEADGVTSTAQAANMLHDELDLEKMGKKNLRPVAILISDGFCTDSKEAYDAAIKALDDSPWGKKCIRVVIAVGKEGDYDIEELKKFDNQNMVIKATDISILPSLIKWVSTVVTSKSSSTKTDSEETVGDTALNVFGDGPDGPVMITQAPDGTIFMEPGTGGWPDDVF